jgi:hypothetical protein
MGLFPDSIQYEDSLSSQTDDSHANTQPGLSNVTEVAYDSTNGRGGVSAWTCVW